MNLRISAGSLVTNHYLEVTDTGVVFCETAAFGGIRNFSYEQIDAVLRGPTSVSFQVGGETYRIPIKPDSAAHRAAVARLVSEARRTVRRVGGV
ncbi:MAG TPA: hypothetical protein VN181_03650 [Thermoanaerobaculia bacterium]|nr:hypothetical protein [Thermoanaerobaculia bacterium]